MFNIRYIKAVVPASMYEQLKKIQKIYKISFRKTIMFILARGIHYAQINESYKKPFKRGDNYAENDGSNKESRFNLGVY